MEEFVINKFFFFNFLFICLIIFKLDKTNGGVVKESSTLKKRKKTKSDEAKDGEKVAGGDEENHIEGLKELQLKQEKRKGFTSFKPFLRTFK